jgi:amidohydrolase
MTGLGGKGVAAVFSAPVPGPVILLRCDMDALPIDETIDLSYRSTVPGVSHKCGHDGHMAILMGVAHSLSSKPLKSGSVVLLFQPAEETGAGAIRILNGNLFTSTEPDMVFALHNLPGFEMGSVVLKEGVFTSASAGIAIELTGVSSHASEPHLGKNPAMAIAGLLQAYSDYKVQMGDDSIMLTITHCRIGEKTFGTSPGSGYLQLTVRSSDEGSIDAAYRWIAARAETAASDFGLDCSISRSEEFPVTINDKEAVNSVLSAARRLGRKVIQPELPFAWSEDFGYFTKIYPGALLGIGAGTDCPPLHSAEYDFPDELIKPGIDIFTGILSELTGSD